MTQKYNNLKLKLDESTQKLSRYLPRNVGKRERCKDRIIEVLESESLELVAENYLLTERVEELEENLSKANASYEKEHNRVYYYKNKDLNADENQQSKINDLKEYIAYIENENSKLVEEVNNFLNQKEIKTFCNGKYTDEVRMIYYELMSMNVSVHNCGNIIRSVLKRLGNLNVGCLPKKSAASIMMVENHMLALMQAGEAIAESESNVLHLDGTKLNFEEIGSFQVVTDSGAYTFGIEDMMSGEAQCYFETFRDILKEASALLASPQECEGTASVMLVTIKNDR